MSVFRRRPHSLWSAAETLSPDHRLFLAIVLSGYGFCRQAVGRDLVAPLQEALAEGLGGRQHTLTSDQIERLVDEALLGILRSSAVPRDGRDVIPDSLARRLPDLLGALACADANHRAGRDGPHVLSQTPYSSHSQTAQSQVLSSWGQLLGLPERLVIGIGVSGFSDRWMAFTTSLLEGMLTGLTRVDSSKILAQGQSALASLPPHLLPYVEAIISSASKATARM